MNVRVRFAPSPTGFLHVGGLRNALYCFLFARQNKGTFILRIEDTDQARTVEGSVENLIQTLDWCGLTADEGPYFQSKRLDIYKKYADQLLQQGSAYRCFCTKEHLDEVRKVQEQSKQAPRYDGHCRSLSASEVEEKIKQAISSVIRMKIPETGETMFADIVHGTVTVANKEIDDQVLMKTDGFPTYHLANVVDDHLMEISHVIRGEEWLPSTPKHVLLYKAFGWDCPEFIHLPLLLNADRSKLSKRQGDVAVEEYIKQGYLKEAILNYIALLGWNPGTDRELFSLDELIREFSFDKVNKSGAVFSREKLDWMNGQYIRLLSGDVLLERAKPFFAGKGNDEFLSAVLKTVRERLKRLDEIPALTHFYFSDPEFVPSLLVWKKSDAAGAKKCLERLLEFYSTFREDWDEKGLEMRTLEFIKKENIGTGDALWPMRVALSGEQNSPGPFEIAAVLGRERTIERLRSAIEKLTNL